MRIRSLRLRLIIFLLLPVTLMLVAVGTIGFLYARDIMLKRWSESAIMSLSQAAHAVDMRLKRPLEMIKLLESSSGPGGDGPILDWTLSRIRALPGVIRAEARITGQPDPARMGSGRDMGGAPGMMFRRFRIAKVEAPVFDPQVGHQAVDLKLSFEDRTGGLSGEILLRVKFEYIIRELTELSWWRTDEAYLVDRQGTILTGTKGTDPARRTLSQQGGQLETAILAAIATQEHGTHLGPGHPPDRVGGFHRLKEAPWTIVLISPGERVLGSIVAFRNTYALGGGLGLALVIFLIWWVTGRMAEDIGAVSQAAEGIAAGDYTSLLITRRADEIGRLMENFNRMVTGLMERDRIRNTFGRYIDPEVAKRFLADPEATALGGRRVRIGLLMSDVRGFTELCETLEPEETIRVVNAYLSGLIEAVQEENGVIVDFLGDSILAFFEPLDGPPVEAARRAVRCALAMQTRTEAFNRAQVEAGRRELKTGIGLHCGEVVLGNIGSRTRTKYGPVGAAVNFTQRLQSQAQGGHIVASDSVLGHLGPELLVSESRTVELKGVSGFQTIHEVIGLGG